MCVYFTEGSNILTIKDDNVNITDIVVVGGGSVAINQGVDWYTDANGATDASAALYNDTPGQHLHISTPAYYYSYSNYIKELSRPRVASGKGGTVIQSKARFNTTADMSFNITIGERGEFQYDGSNTIVSYYENGELNNIIANGGIRDTSVWTNNANGDAQLDG